MQQNQQPRHYYNTRRAAVVLGGILPASLATALYRNGHYCGIKPTKLPNGRLLWAADEIDALAAGAHAGAAPDLGGRLAAGRQNACARRADMAVVHERDSLAPETHHASLRSTQDGCITPHLICLIAAAGSGVAALATVANWGL